MVVRLPRRRHRGFEVRPEEEASVSARRVRDALPREPLGRVGVRLGDPGLVGADVSVREFVVFEDGGGDLVGGRGRVVGQAGVCFNYCYSSQCEGGIVSENVRDLY